MYGLKKKKCSASFTDYSPTPCCQSRSIIAGISNISVDFACHFPHRARKRKSKVQHYLFLSNEVEKNCRKQNMALNMEKNRC